MPVGDIYQTNTFFDFQGQTANVYIWYLFTVNDANTSSNEDALNDYFETSVLTPFAIFLVDDFVFNCIETKLFLDQSQQEPKSGISIVRNVDLPGGESIKDGLPGQCSMVLQTIADLNDADPSERGRDFYTGFPVDAQADGVWTDTAMLDVTTLIALTLGGQKIVQNGGEWLWVNVSGKKIAERKAAAGPPFPLIFSDIRWIRPLKQVRTQRRRQAENPCDRYGTIVEVQP